ncbi:hypothetical protein GCM10010430_80060 [Kitasatospora cystarginea]|uniref:Uncharacterized protein n=1 Tax=Kitasatospora cystarginea TaxID=58350 RepID=A0ABP5RYZ1_9ACTN
MRRFRLRAESRSSPLAFIKVVIPVTDSPTSSHDVPVPVTALIKLTELKELASTAVDCWNNGDQKGAFDAVGASMPVAAAAATALNILLELDRVAAQSAENERRRTEEDASAWWG